MHNQVGYHPSKFQLDHYINEREIAFWMNLGLLTQFWNYFHHSPSITRISSQHCLGFFLSVLVTIVVSYNCEGFLCPWEHYQREKRLNVIALLQHGCSTREMSKLLGTSQSTCSRICRVCSSCGAFKKRAPRNITLAQQWVFLRAIILVDWIML